MQSSNDYRTSAASLFATQARQAREADEAPMDYILVCHCGRTADMRIEHEADGWCVAPLQRCPEHVDAAEIVRTQEWVGGK
jgi:hypothetical protein